MDFVKLCKFPRQLKLGGVTVFAISQEGGRRHFSPDTEPLAVYVLT